MDETSVFFAKFGAQPTNMNVNGARPTVVLITPDPI
jgi:hypothetical protein